MATTITVEGEIYDLVAMPRRDLVALQSKVLGLSRDGQLQAEIIAIAAHIEMHSGALPHSNDPAQFTP